MIIYGSFTGHFDRPEGLLDVDMFGSQEDLDYLLGLNLTQLKSPTYPNKSFLIRKGKPIGWTIIDYETIDSELYTAMLRAGAEPSTFEGHECFIASKNVCLIIKKVVAEVITNVKEKHLEDLDANSLGALTEAEKEFENLYRIHLLRTNNLL